MKRPLCNILHAATMKRLILILAAAPVLAPSVWGAVIYSGYQNLAVPDSFEGVYLNLGTGTSSGSYPGDMAFDAAPWINPFMGGVNIGTSPLLRPVVSLTPGDGIAGNDRILNLSVGTLVNNSATFTPGVNGSTTHFTGGQFSLNTPGNIGFQFEAAPTAPTRYGWLNTTISNTVAGGAIIDWAYEDSGASIVVGRVSQSAPSAGAQLFTLSPGTGESFTLGSLISDTGGNTNSVLKTGDGATTLSPGNSYTGTTTVSAGTLLLGGDGVLPDTSAVTLSGGNLSMGGFDDSAGVFSLTGAGVKIIDMGAGGGSLLTFLSTNTSSWTGKLEIWNWTGAINTAGTPGTSDQLVFTSHSGTSYFDGSRVQFYSGPGTGPMGYGAAFYGNELVAIPEASTVAGVMALVGLIGWRERRHFLRCPEARLMAAR